MERLPTAFPATTPLETASVGDYSPRVVLSFRSAARRWTTTDLTVRSTGHRGDLQGLRAVAVLLVVLGHAGGSRHPGRVRRRQRFLRAVGVLHHRTAPRRCGESAHGLVQRVLSSAREAHSSRSRARDHRHRSCCLSAAQRRVSEGGDRRQLFCGLLRSEYPLRARHRLLRTRATAVTGAAFLEPRSRGTVLPRLARDLGRRSLRACSLHTASPTEDHQRGTRHTPRETADRRRGGVCALTCVVGLGHLHACDCRVLLNSHTSLGTCARSADRGGGDALRAPLRARPTRRRLCRSFGNRSGCRVLHRRDAVSGLRRAAPTTGAALVIVAGIGGDSSRGSAGAS